MLLGAVGFAPAQVPNNGRWPIERIAIEGLRVYSRDQVLAVLALKPGQTAGKPEFEAARDRLVASGAFETVGYRFEPGSKREGYVLTLQVTEVQQVFPVLFDDLHVSTKDLEAALRARDPMFSPEKLAATQPVLQRYSHWIEEYLTAKGVPEKIAASVEPADPGDYRIAFRPARPLPAVAQVIFEGNKVVTQQVLWEAAWGAAIGLPYTEDAFRQVLRASVRPVYEARGRVRVSFPKIRTEEDKEVKGVNVFVTVDEGPSYEFGKIALTGETPIAPDTLLKSADVKTGDVANFDKMNEGTEKMRKSLAHAGYLDAKVSFDRKIDDEEKKVAVTVRVEPGSQYTMGTLTLAGLDLDGESEMKRIWILKEGKPYNPDYPDLFLRRVKEDGMFDNLGPTKAETKVNEKAHTVDVTLRFSPAAPGGRGPGRRGGRGRGGVKWTLP